MGDRLYNGVSASFFLFRQQGRRPEHRTGRPRVAVSYRSESRDGGVMPSFGDEGFDVAHGLGHMKDNLCGKKFFYQSHKDKVRESTIVGELMVPRLYQR